MKIVAHFWCGVILLAGGCLPPASASELTVEGTKFVFQQDGRILRSPELVGAEIDLSGSVKLRIDAVRTDPANPDILLHRFSLQEPGGKWINPCIADGKGLEEGFPLPGRWDTATGFYPDKHYFSLTCTSGAEAKCVRAGYKPWKESSNGQDMTSLFESCVRMIRADYCGDGTAMTRDGMTILGYDGYLVRRPKFDPSFEFEAGWTPKGAVCVNHTRVPDRVTLDGLKERCPRLRVLAGIACTEEIARKAGAILYNMSRNAGSAAKAP